jgi:hypothetical protein
MLAAAAVIGSSAGAGTQLSAPPKIDVSTNASVLTYLNKLGINTKGFVIQRGAKNYAGLACPGRAWNCTRSLQVVQIASSDDDNRGGGQNKFFCTDSPDGSETEPGQCEIVQVSTDASNKAYCVERSDAEVAAQDCTITQVTTTGHNWAYVSQTVDTDDGADQEANQYAGVRQESSDGGSNVVEIHQTIKQTTRQPDSGGTQNQEGHQAVGVLQDTFGDGDNVAHVIQSLSQQAAATGPVVQNQNVEPELNTSAGIEQESTTGRNVAHLQQTNDLDAWAKKKGPVSQNQGDPDGGMLGHFDQLSDGVSVVKGSQKESQHAHFDGKKSESVSQVQYGPMSFGSEQFDNPSNRYDIDQRSTQLADRPSYQQNEQVGHCETSGLCTLAQVIRQNDESARNTCEGSVCFEGQTMISSEGETTTTPCTDPNEESGDSCDTPPPPPPPPPPLDEDEGCEIECGPFLD